MFELDRDARKCSGNSTSRLLPFQLSMEILESSQRTHPPHCVQLWILLPRLSFLPDSCRERRGQPFVLRVLGYLAMDVLEERFNRFVLCHTIQKMADCADLVKAFALPFALT